MKWKALNVFDWGQIENGGIDALTEIYVKFHEEAEKEPSLNDEARAAFFCPVAENGG